MINIVELKRKVIDEALNGSLLGEKFTFENQKFIHIANIYTGESTNDDEKKKYSVKVANCYSYVATKDISMDGKVNYENGMYIPKNISKFSVAPENSILLCIEGGNAGNKIAILNRQVCFVNKLCCFDVFGADNRFIYYYLLSNQFRNNFKSQMTGLIGGVSAKKIKSLLIPLPKLDEQKRIVSKLDEIFAELDKIDANQHKLVALQDKLEGKFLQLAIQGKLVEQRPEEDTGEELFKQIQSEKQELIKQDKIKKEKPLAKISEDEIPFEIPSSWKWVRLGDICTKIVDGDHNPPAGLNIKTNYLMVSAININNNCISSLDRVRYLSKELFEEENLRTRLEVGDILFTIVGTMGRSCIYDGKLYLSFQRSVSVLTTLTYNFYLKNVLDSKFIRSFMEINSTGTAQKGFYLNQVKKLLIPLPPLEEQKRIVAKLNELLPLCKMI